VRWRLQLFASRASARARGVRAVHATVPFGWADDLGSWVGPDRPPAPRSWHVWHDACPCVLVRDGAR
jgi:hypothetical protein